MKIEPLNRLTSGSLSVGKMNTNSDRIENALDNTISRDGSTPNDMQTNFDMGDNRIINVGEPQDLNDAVRYIDLQEAVVGDFTVSADWSDLTGVPLEFPPEAHVHTVAEITGFQEAVEDIIGGKVVGGSNITVAYNDTTGETTISASGSLAGDWNTLLNKPSVFPPDTHTQASSTITDFQEAVEDLIGASITAGTNITVSYNDGTGKTTINSTGGGGSSSGNYVNFVDVFGGVADGVTSNDTAFTNAEASSYNTIFLPQGNYWTTKANSFFNKNYIGEGKILITSGTSVLPGKRNLASQPSFGTISTEYGESGDTKFPDVIQYQYIRAGTRQRVLTEHKTNPNYGYFQAGATGNFIRFFSLSGGSGTSAHLVASANATATTADVNSATGLSNGDTIGFTTNDGVAPGDIVTISSISVGGGVGGSDRITFSPALANSYPYAGSDYAVPTYVSGYSTNSRVMKGMRTHNSHYFMTVDSTGEGDVYGIVGRVSNSYVVKPGQTDFFEGCTVAFVGGDMLFTGDGQYGTPWEFAVNDQGHDVAVINVHTYTRTNDTGARRATWIHSLVKSEGSKPIDVAYSLHGNARVGLDFVPASFSSNSEAAIQLKSGQRIYFDSSASTGAAGIGTRARGFWGNLVGDSYVTHGADGSSEYVDVFVGGTRTLRQRPTSLNTSVQLNVNNNINCSTQVAVSTGGSFRLNGVNGNTYLQFDGLNIYLVKNGSVVQTW